MTRRTAWPIDDDRLGHTIEMPNAPGRPMPDDLARAYRDRVYREIVKAVEERGYTTHIDIVKAACDRFTTDGAYGDREHYRFPPARPRKGDPVRYDNGPLKGDESTVFEGITFAMKDAGLHDITYRPVAFDTGTGHWIYAAPWDFR